MSVDRGFLGKAPPGEMGGMAQAMPLGGQFKSMENIAFGGQQQQQPNKGLELVRLLRDAEKGGYTPEDLQVMLSHFKIK